jgi:hypothetical protein
VKNVAVYVPHARHCEPETRCLTGCFICLELLFYATGSSVLQLFGYKDHGELASWLTGVALWMLAGLAILVLAAL